MVIDIKPLFDKLMKDPDVVPEEGSEKEDLALAMAVQRATQSINNNRALNMAVEKSAIEKLANFSFLKKAPPIEFAKPGGSKEEPDKDVILRETVDGKDWEYRIGRVNGNYRSELRGVRPDGTYSDWEDAHLGQAGSEEGAITAFAKNYGKGGGGQGSTIDRSPLEDAELFHPQLQGHLEDSRKAIAGRKGREGEKKAAEETATKTRQARIESIDKAAVGKKGKFTKATINFKGRLDGSPQTITGYAYKGLMYHEGSYGAFSITHQDSGLFLLGNFSPVSNVQTAIRRLAHVTDWSKIGKTAEEANAFIRGNRELQSAVGGALGVLRNDVYGDISEHAPSEFDTSATPTPSKKAAASKPKTASTAAPSKEPDEEILARSASTSDGRGSKRSMEYRVKRITEEGERKGKFQIEVRVVTDDVPDSRWSPAMMGVKSSKNAAINNFAQRYGKLSLIDSEVFHPLLEKHKATAQKEKETSDTEFKAKEERQKAESNAQLERKLKLDAEIKGSLQTKPVTSYGVEHIREDGSTSTKDISGRGYKGLMYNKDLSTPSRGWMVSHIDSGFAVLGDEKGDPIYLPLNEARMAMHRLSQITDWTKLGKNREDFTQKLKDDPELNKRIRGVREVISRNVYGDISAHVPSEEAAPIEGGEEGERRAATPEAKLTSEQEVTAERIRRFATTDPEVAAKREAAGAGKQPESKPEADAPVPKASAVQRLTENIESREAADLEGFSDSEKTEYKKLEAERADITTDVDAWRASATPEEHAKEYKSRTPIDPARKALIAFNKDVKGQRLKELDKKLKGFKDAEIRTRREQERKDSLIDEGTGGLGEESAPIEIPSWLMPTAAPNEHATPEGVEEPQAGTKVHTMADAAQRGDELYNAFVNPVDSEGNRVEWDSKEFDSGVVPKKVRDNLPDWISSEQAQEVWSDFSSVVSSFGEGTLFVEDDEDLDPEERKAQAEGLGQTADEEIRDRLRDSSTFVEAISGSWESLNFKGDKAPDPKHGFPHDHGLHERRFATYDRAKGSSSGRAVGSESETLRNHLIEMDDKIREYNEDNPDTQVQPVAELMDDVLKNPAEWHAEHNFTNRLLLRKDSKSPTGFSANWNMKSLEQYILNRPKDPKNIESGSMYEDFLPMELQSKASDEYMTTKWESSDVYYNQMHKWQTFAGQAFDQLDYERGGKQSLQRAWSAYLDTPEVQEAMYPEGDPWEDQGGSWEKGRITGGWQPYEGEPFGDTPEKIEAERWRRIKASHESVHAEFISFMRNEVAGDFTWRNSEEVKNPKTGEMETKARSVKGIQDALDKDAEDLSPDERVAVKAFNHQVDYQLENTNFATRSVPVIGADGKPKTFVDDKGKTQILTEKQGYNIKNLPAVTGTGFELQAEEERTLADYVEVAKTTKQRRGRQRKDRKTSRTPRPERAVGETEETTDDTPSDELPDSLRDAITKVVASEDDHRAVRTKVDRLVDDYLKEHLGDGAAEARDPDVSTTVHLHESDRQQWVDSILKKAAEHMTKEVEGARDAPDSNRFKDVNPISWSKKPRDAEDVINTITGTTPKAREHTSVEGDDDQTKAANKLVEEGIVGNFDDAHKLLGDLTENEIRDMHKNVNAQRPFTTKSVNSAVMKARIHAIKTAREAAEAKDKADASGQDAKPADGAQTDAHRQKLSDAGIDPEGLSHLNTDELISDHIEAKHAQEEADEAKDIADTTIHPDPNAVPEGGEQAKLEGMPEEEKTFKGSHQARKAFMDHYGEDFNARLQDGTLDPPEGQDKWGVGDASKHVADDLKSKETTEEPTAAITEDAPAPETPTEDAPVPETPTEEAPASETPTEEAAPTEEKKPVVTETGTPAAPTTETATPESEGVKFGPDVEPTTGTKPVVSEDTGKKHVADREKAAATAEEDKDDAKTAEMRQYIKDNLEHSIYNSERAVDLVTPAAVHKQFELTQKKHSEAQGRDTDIEQKEGLARRLGALVHGDAWDTEDQDAFVESIDSLTVNDLQSSIKERQRNHLTATTAKYNAEAKEAAAIIAQHKKIRANDISALVGDLPPETGRAAATDRFRAIMRHLNEHETGMDKKVIEQLHEAEYVATQAGADVKTVNAEAIKHNQSMLGKKEIGKDAKGVMQYEDTGEEGTPYYDTQEDTDVQASHGHSLGEEDAYHDLLSGHGGHEARRHAFENSDSNRFVHHDEGGNVTHTTHQHEDYGDESSDLGGTGLGKRRNRLRGRTKEEPEVQARSHHNDDHHVPAKYGEEDEPKKKNATGRKHSPDWQAYPEGELDREEGERIRAENLDKHHRAQDQSDAPIETVANTGEKSDWEKEQERMARGQAPGPAPRAGLVWAAGIHHWVKPEKLAELQGGIGSGQAVYIPPNKLQEMLGHEATNKDGSLVHDMSANHSNIDGVDSGKRGHQGGMMVTRSGIHAVGNEHEENEDGSLIMPDALEANAAQRHDGGGDSLTQRVLAETMRGKDRDIGHLLEQKDLAGTGINPSEAVQEADPRGTPNRATTRAFEKLGIPTGTAKERFDARRDNPGIVNAIKREVTGGEYGEMRRKGASMGDVMRQLGSDLRQTARENLSDTKPFHGIPAGLAHSVKDVATGGKSKRHRNIQDYVRSEVKRKKEQDTQTKAVGGALRSGVESRQFSMEDVRRLLNND